MTEERVRTNWVYAGLGASLIAVVAGGFFWLGQRLPVPSAAMERRVAEAQPATPSAAAGTAEADADMAWARAVVHALDEGFQGADKRADERYTELVTLVRSLEMRLDGVEDRVLTRVDESAATTASATGAVENPGTSLLDKAILVVDEQIEQLATGGEETDATGDVAAREQDRSKEKAKERDRLALVRTLVRSGLFGLLEAYRSDVGDFPSSDDGGLLALVRPPQDDALALYWNGPYVVRFGDLLDPWGNELFYDCPGDLNTRGYDLASAGPDGEFGTSDDVTNWDESSLSAPATSRTTPVIRTTPADERRDFTPRYSGAELSGRR